MAVDVAPLDDLGDPGGRPLAVVDVLVADASQPESDHRRGDRRYFCSPSPSLAPLIAPNDPTDGELADSLAPPGQGYLLGADKNGRDVLSRLIYGTRTALGGALMIVVISEVIGVPIGIWAAYRGGWVDETVTRVWDMLLAFPPLLLAFAVVAAFGPGLPKAAFSLGYPLCAVHRARRAQRDARAERDGLHRGRARARLRPRADHLPAHSAQLRFPDHRRVSRSTSPTRCSTWRRCRFLDSECSRRLRTGERCSRKVSLCS